MSASIFLVGTFILTAFASALRHIQRRSSRRELQELDKLFFYHSLHRYFLPFHEDETLVFATVSTLNICRFLFAFAVSALIFIHFGWLQQHLVLSILLGIGLLILCFLVSEYLPRALGTLYSKKCLWLLSPFASLFLFVAFPMTYLFIKLSQLLFRFTTFDYLHEPLDEAKQEIYDIIHDADVEDKLEPQDKKLIESVVSFCNLIAREVMVPRVDLFSLPATASIKEAARRLQEEGYSRTPIYKGTIDDIIGVLMYKDILAQYMEAIDKNDFQILEKPIETLIKPVIYTPETKKISHLLQEFRKKQLHLAIVVDEYGGTEGIVTIEDILEEIVGNIEDEYDDEEDLFITLPDGSLIVDARLPIFDLEEQLNITLEEEGDFDTLGGYIFHKAGEIPTRGFVIKQDDFELEVLRAGERSIEKVKIKLKKIN